MNNSSSTTGAKRKNEGAEGSTAKKAAAVPQIVKVEMGDSSDDDQKEIVVRPATTTAAQDSAQPADSPSSVPASMPANGGEARLPTKVDWQLLCDRALLQRLLRAPKNVSAKGAAYISFDIAEYEANGGTAVNLGQYNHIKVETPFMSNLFGISSKCTQGNWAHSINFDVSDSQGDKLVPRFAQFLALMDDVCLDICINLVAECSFFQKEVGEWLRFSAGADGKVDMKKLADIVATKFNGALRISQKTKDDKTVTDKTIEVGGDGKYRIPTVFFFKTKIWSKKDNDKLPDIVTYNMSNQKVYWSTETAAFKIKDKDGEEEIKPVLAHPRATYVRAQIELPSINWAQKEFHATWVTTKIKYKTRNAVEKTASETDNVADFDDQAAPVYATAADLERVKREESNAIAATNLDADA